MKQRTKRIYCGPEGRETSIWWNVKVSEARRAVTINGSILHALKAHAGVTVGCGLSRMAMDNAKAFPHPVYLASFTKSTALLVDKLKRNGEPAHAVLYKHRYGHITDHNDDGTLKRLVKENPSLIERPFILRPPRPAPLYSGPNAGKTPAHEKGQSNRARAFVPRGALRRAVMAGRIGKNVAEQLSEVAVRGEEPDGCAS
jgi:hypothetical protein